MAVKPNISVTNNFTAGLKTEFTGLNFPENAATSVDNCVFTLIGDVLRREGIDFEPSYVQTAIDRTGKAISTYKWNNVGGDGLTQIVVVQVGGTLYFFQSSAATVSSPLSAHKLASTITLSTFLPAGSVLDPSIAECQYADGNGYLFVYHPNLETFYCTFNAGTIVGNLITVQARDFDGLPEPGVADNFRPPSASLGTVHGYNLANQGWGKLVTFNWSQNIALGVTNTLTTGNTALPIVVGDQIRVTKSGTGGVDFQTGSVSSYSHVTGDIIMNIATFGGTGGAATWGVDANPGLIATWINGTGSIPSNADVWWNFKNTSNVFDPKTTLTQTTLNSGPAPKGYMILPAFNLDRSAVSQIGSFTPVTTSIRPKTGAWFQGRVWYTGVDASVATTSTSSGFYSWTEKIYFSQVITSPDQFGKCYEINDPTSETLFDLLPTDGGVISIQGCGSIYKLFSIQNGLLVFAANGIWFITGSQGIGFSANDYTITKISSVQNISSTSYVNAQGYPVFWNEEGIYAVSPSQQGGGLTVDNITLGSIFSFYADIPLQSKKFVRGDYNYVDYEIQWCYRSTNESSVTSRYQFDKILVYNTVNKAFYVYTLSGTPWIHDVRYVVGPGGSTSPDPMFKYLTSAFTSGVYNFTFSHEHDTSYKDWKSFDTVGTNYISTFTSGYRVHGNGIGQWQPVYLYMYLRNDVPNGYKIQSAWNYATSRDSGQWSSIQLINNNKPYFGMLTRRHKLRGHGLAFQLKVSSVDGLPFDVMGWTAYEMVNTTP